MPKFIVIGANVETGIDETMTVIAADEADARAKARAQDVLASGVFVVDSMDVKPAGTRVSLRGDFETISTIAVGVALGIIIAGLLVIVFGLFSSALRGVA